MSLQQSKEPLPLSPTAMFNEYNSAARPMFS